MLIFMHSFTHKYWVFVLFLLIHKAKYKIHLLVCSTSYKIPAVYQILYLALEIK